MRLADAIPPGAVLLKARDVETWLAVIGGAVSFGQVATALGLANRASALYRLERAEAAGLVTWDRGKYHTVRPVLGLVIYSEGRNRQNDWR